jgi:dynein intermediate chain 1
MTWVTRKVAIVHVAGSLLPLWDFSVFPQFKKSATCVEFMNFEDLVCVGYGTLEYLKQQKGMICLFSFKNPSHPEYIIDTAASVTCLHVHPHHDGYVVAGFTDGSVAVYNFRSPQYQTPIFKSEQGHTEQVSQIKWQKDDLDEHFVFFSIGGDGRVIQWTCLKTEMVSNVYVVHIGYHSTKDAKSCFGIML